MSRKIKLHRDYTRVFNLGIYTKMRNDMEKEVNLGLITSH